MMTWIFKCYLLHSLLVAATFEGCGEVFVHDGTCGVGSDESSWHDEYVGIVVLADEVSYLGNPCEAGAYVLMFVERHGDAFA